MPLKEHIRHDMTQAMRAKKTLKLSVTRLLIAAIKKQEIDDRRELDDAGIWSLVAKMIKQRQEAALQFIKAQREELALKEQAEVEILKAYLPLPLSEKEIARAIDEAIKKAKAQSLCEMGQVMGLLKPRLQGRCDMGSVSKQVKKRLAGAG